MSPLSLLLLLLVSLCLLFSVVHSQGEEEIELLPFFAAASIPTLEEDLAEEIYEALRQGVEDFCDDLYSGSYNDRRRRLQTYGSVSLTTQTTRYNGGIPEPQFNIYAQYGGTTIFSSPGRLKQRALQNTTLPTGEELMELILESDTTVLLEEFLGDIEGLNDTDEFVFGLVSDIETSVPSSMPSAMPSTISSPEPTPAPTPDPCPCRRFQLVCRILNRCLFGYD